MTLWLGPWVRQVGALLLVWAAAGSVSAAFARQTLPVEPELAKSPREGPQADSPLPAALLPYAGRNPEILLMLLADAGVPCGLEIRASQTARAELGAFGYPRTPTVPESTLVNAFNTAHRDYRMAIEDGVIVIRPAEARNAYLDAPAAVSHASVIGIMNALRLIFADLDPALRRPGGIMGSCIGCDSEGERRSISLSGTNLTNEDLLNQIVKQRPQAWIVETTDGGARVSRVGFVYHRGATRTIALNGH